MRWSEILVEDDMQGRKIVPKSIMEACEAGLDDVRHGRTVEGNKVLAAIDRKLADYKRKNKHGENKPNGQPSN